MEAAPDKPALLGIWSVFVTEMMEWNCELLSELREPRARSGITPAITILMVSQVSWLNSQEAASSKQSGLINSEVHHPVSMMPWLPGASGRSVLASAERAEDTIYWFRISRAAMGLPSRQKEVNFMPDI